MVLFFCFTTLTASKLSKCIARFSIQAILDAPHASVVQPDSMSRFEYDCNRDSHFRVLSDECTVLGVRLENKQLVAKENIVDDSVRVVTFEAASSDVYTLVVDEIANFVLTGESNRKKGRVVQYTLNTATVIKDYDSLGIGTISSSARLGSLCFFGGYDSASVAVVDIIDQKVVSGPIKTAVKSIFSVTVCETNKKTLQYKAVLAIAGRNINFSDKHPDLFEVTGLVKENSHLNSLPRLLESLRESKETLEAKASFLAQALKSAQAEHRKERDEKDSAIKNLKELSQNLKNSLDKLINTHSNETSSKDKQLAQLSKENSFLQKKLQRAARQLDLHQRNTNLNVALGIFVKTVEQKNAIYNRSAFPQILNGITQKTENSQVERLQKDLKKLQNTNQRLLKDNARLSKVFKKLKQKSKKTKKLVETLTEAMANLNSRISRCKKW